MTSHFPDIAIAPPDAPGSSASRWLRAETRAAHVAVEAQLDLSGLHDRTDLAALLRGWDTIWYTVGAAAGSPTACQEAVDELLASALQARRWIRSDLADLGGEVISAPGVQCGERLAALLTVPAESWGVAYVLRGARLGGAVLASRVHAQLGSPTDCGTRFLRSAGTNTGREWVAFRGRLDGLTLSRDELERAAGAARWTFGWVAVMTTSAAGIPDSACGQPVGSVSAERGGFEPPMD